MLEKVCVKATLPSVKKVKKSPKKAFTGTFDFHGEKKKTLGRGRLIIVSPTNGPACPVKALGELLMCPTNATNLLFTNGGETPTAE